MALTATVRGRVEEAVTTLARYNKDPFITDFLRQQPKVNRVPAQLNKEDLCDLMRDVLLGEYKGKRKYALKLDDLVAYLDRLQETGRQHLYLFHLPEEGRGELLARLRDLNEVKALLGGDEDLYEGGGRLVWEARDAPQLALVRHDPPGVEPPTRLVLKWVETRAFSYWVTQKSNGSHQTGKPYEEEGEEQEAEEIEEAEGEESRSEPRVKVQVKGEERSATFFVVNLESGDCELRIQALRGLAKAARQQQLSLYRALVASLFKLELVGPTVLAPAIRRSLLAREAEIVHCVAVLPSGGRFTGGRGELPPVDIRDLEAGVAVRFVWPPLSGGRVELDGRLDEVLIHRPLLSEQHRALLERVRRWRQEGLNLFTAPPEPVPASATPDPTSTGGASPPAGVHVSRGKFWVTSMKVAFGRDVRLEVPSTPGINRATREYTQTHAVEEPGGDASPAVKAQSPGALPSTMVFAGDERPLKQFLSYIKEVAQNEHLTYEREIEIVRKEERWNFILSIVAAVLALVIFTTGAVLLLFYSATVIGSITALLGVLTGNGTRLIFRYANSLKAKRELIQNQQRDSSQTLMAIQTALAIPDRELRSHAMTKVASSLLERVTGLKQPPKQVAAPKPAEVS